MNKFIAFDNETGGLAQETSLLTVYFAILDDKLNQIDELDLRLKPNNGGPYLVEAGGLEVNKINLIEHDKTAITYSEGGQALVKLLKKHAIGKDRLTPLGHNVFFDIRGVTTHLLGDKTWNQFVSYKIQDTQQCASFLQRKGLLPPDMSVSLGSLAKHFNISLTSGVEHESKYDTLLTIEVYKRLLTL
jgi:DNA polymerase III alpha subunit (gram-positive type)